MEFDARLRDKLIGTLRTELPKLEISPNGRLDIQSVFNVDKAFSAALQGASREVKEQLETYVGERPLLALMLGTLTDELALIPPETKQGKTLLCDLQQYSDVEALANRLFAMLVALPHEYIAVVELPVGVAVDLYKKNAPPLLGRQVAVIGSWHGKVDGYPALNLEEQPPDSGLADLFGVTPTSLISPDLQSVLDAPAPRCHLYVKLKGYIRSVYSQQPMNRFTTLLKAFFGLGLGMEIFESGWRVLGGSQLLITVYEAGAAGFVKGDDDIVRDSASALIRKIRVHAGGRRRIVDDLRTIVQVLDMDEELPQLALAGRWLFDSHSNSDDVMGFMQLAICAEVLLGTEDGGEGVIAMLATRCAYLIARSAKERDNLAAEFKNIYKVRSKIVHRGLGALKENERNQFHRLRAICNRVIQKEIQLAIMDAPEREEAARLVEALRSGSSRG